MVFPARSYSVSLLWLFAAPVFAEPSTDRGDVDDPRTWPVYREQLRHLERPPIADDDPSIVEFVVKIAWAGPAGENPLRAILAVRRKSPSTDSSSAGESL